MTRQIVFKRHFRNHHKAKKENQADLIFNFKNLREKKNSTTRSSFKFGNSLSNKRFCNKDIMTSLISNKT